MAEFEIGTLIENPRMPGWGPGKVVHVEGGMLHVVFRDAPDPEPKRFRPEALRLAPVQSDPVLDGIPAGGGANPVTGPARRATSSRPARTAPDPGQARAAISWLGSEGDELWSAFRLVLGPQPEAFGSPSLGWAGLHDGTRGVQWNAARFLRPRHQRVGVNLEGMTYDGWPVGRLIVRELERPTLPDLVRGLPDAERILLIWERDYWQASSRVQIKERRIAPTPIPLSQLTSEAWRDALTAARACLERSGGSFRRGTQEVTLAASGVRRPGEVSPHLMFQLRADTERSWDEFLADARGRLEPIHDWARKRSAP